MLGERYRGRRDHRPLPRSILHDIGACRTRRGLVGRSVDSRRVAKDGVHFLCLFDPDKDDRLERYIGECGVHDPTRPSPTGNLDSAELLEVFEGVGCRNGRPSRSVQRGAAQDPSRPSSDRRLDFAQPACLRPARGPVGDAPDGIRQILQNKDAEHGRPRPVAIVNASDASDPEDLKKSSASSFIKMSRVSVEGFRQAFLDPESRIRLNSDPFPEPHAEFVSMTWEGGFLGDTSVHFNGNLNALVGGRGTGKSTMIESIRYVLGLEPLGEEARKAHEGVVKHVLKPGTKVSLLVRSHHPSESRYVFERSVPNPPTVKDENGDVLTVSPRDVMPGVQVFGQHEISELARSPEKLTVLLERFAERDASLSGQKKELRLGLERSRPPDRRGSARDGNARRAPRGLAGARRDGEALS